jgi:hypothetical protein
MANANSENPYVGRKFQELVQSILEKEFSTSFEQEAVVAIGKPPKGHKFDLANEDRSIVAECKCYTWTDSGNVPSAKLMGLDEAVFYFGFLPVGTKKILCMKKATFQGKTETLMAPNTGLPFRWPPRTRFPTGYWSRCIRRR